MSGMCTDAKFAIFRAQRGINVDTFKTMTELAEQAIRSARWEFKTPEEHAAWAQAQVVDLREHLELPPCAPEQWRPMDTSPTDGTIVRLLVDYSGEDACHPLEDAEIAQTVGGNTDGHTGLNEGWKFAGWSWEQDCSTEGRGRPLGWLPMGSAVPPGVAPASSASGGGEQ